MMINGIGISPGIAIGKASIFKRQAVTFTGILLRNEGDILIEIEKFDNAVSASIIEVETIIGNYDPSHGNEELKILEAHIELLSDSQIKEDVIDKISKEKKNANDALIEVIQNAVTLFKSMGDEYMSARASDIEDIGYRILKNLSSFRKTASRKYKAGTIIVSDDLTPSDTITLDSTKVIGFVTQVGGKTSHTAIIAKARGIPAVVGCGDSLSAVQDNDTIILDGQTGLVMINPSKNTIKQYEIKRHAWQQQYNLLKALKDVSAITADGASIKLLANIADPDEMEHALELGAVGAGLFRTEFLFLGRDSFPTEDEQFEFYKAVVLKAKNKPVTVRTLDIGGDKQLPYFDFPEEQNPFLGYRAIRFCLDRKDIFITQLKAILRASAFGKLKIMFPMISNIKEIRSAKVILKEAKNELLKDNISFDHGIEVGIMIEIPSAAIIADLLAREVDFFSIGTNDLTQYTLAVDRMNEKIKDLYDPFDPAVLRLISHVLEQGRKNNIEVGMCGELASDPRATLLLLGMGLTEFSMTSASIPQIKNIIINNSIKAAKRACEDVMNMNDSKSILNYLERIAQ